MMTLAIKATFSKPVYCAPRKEKGCQAASAWAPGVPAEPASLPLVAPIRPMTRKASIIQNQRFDEPTRRGEHLFAISGEYSCLEVSSSIRVTANTYELKIGTAEGKSTG